MNLLHFRKKLPPIFNLKQKFSFLRTLWVDLKIRYAVAGSFRNSVYIQRVLDYRDLNYREFAIPGKIRYSIYSSYSSIIRIVLGQYVVPKLQGLRLSWNFFLDLVIPIIKDPLYIYFLQGKLSKLLKFLCFYDTTRRAMRFANTNFLGLYIRQQGEVLPKCKEIQKIMVVVQE